MNIACRIEQQAKSRPKQLAVKFPQQHSNYKYTYEGLSFEEFNKMSSHYAACLNEKGINNGDKVLLFVRPSLDFPLLTFALFKIGATPIMIDPGMGKKNLLNAIESAKPDALIAVPEVHFIRLLYRKTFSSIKTFVTTGKSLWPGLHSVKSFKKDYLNQVKSYETAHKNPDDMAAILFTSGGTGRPKGVVYTHKIFNKQTDTLQKIFGLTDQDVDIPGFPLFSFFTMAMGMTSCIPDMNPSKPAQCDPRSLVQNIKDNSATFVAGSPAIWERVADYCLSQNLVLDTVKYVVMFGAPVRTELHQKFEKILPIGTTYTPYGATESLPVSSISGKEILEGLYHETTKGNGTCIGMPAPEIEVRIIKAHDQVIENIKDANFLEANEVGEIIVKGDVVTPRYLNMPEKTAEAKISDGDSFWHRMGDMGKLDEQGRLWFFGRKVHRIDLKDQTKFSVACEAIFNKHPDVKRTALIKVEKNNNIIPAIVIEPKSLKIDRDKMIKEMNDLAKDFNHTNDIKDYYFCSKFPVDVRHNIKIDRKLLGEQASGGKLQ